VSPAWIASALRNLAHDIDSDGAPSRSAVSSRLMGIAADAATSSDSLTLLALPGDGGSFWEDDGELQKRFDSLMLTAGASRLDWDSDRVHVSMPSGSRRSVLRALGQIRSGACGDDVADFASSLEPHDGASGIASVASRVAAPRRPKRPKRRRTERIVSPEERHAPKQVALSDVLAEPTEFSCNLDISLSVDFEGSTTKQQLVKRLKDELVTAIKSAVSATAQELDLQPSNVMVRPIKADCAVNDQGSVEGRDD